MDELYNLDEKNKVGILQTEDDMLFLIVEDSISEILKFEAVHLCYINKRQDLIEKFCLQSYFDEFEKKRKEGELQYEFE